MSMITWLDAPGEVVIRCPQCSGQAIVDTPFEYLPVRSFVRDTGEQPANTPAGWHWQHIEVSGRGAYFVLLPDETPDISHLKLRIIDNWVVFEKYPSVEGSYYDKDDVVIKCTRCHLIAAHKIIWPNDAYYQWDIRG
jgi:hypothetical protein